MPRRTTPAVALLATGALAATALGTAATWAGASSAPAKAPSSSGENCQTLSTPRTIITGKKPQTYVYTAPEGRVVTYYCVEDQGGGVEYIRLQTPAQSVLMRKGDGKAILAYSVLYESEATPTPSATPTTPSATPTSPSATPTTPSATPTSPSATPTETPTSPSATPTEITEDDIPEVTGPPATNPDGSFNWNWRYDPPSCSALTVLYPSNIPDNQTNDVNVRIRFTDGTTRTLNYHFNGGNWTGMRAFNYVQHRDWPIGTAEYWVEWTQVGGSNYHYGESFHNAPVEGPLHCVLGDDGDPATVEVPQSVTTIDDWDAARRVVRQGARTSTEIVTVDETGLSDVQLERTRNGVDWQVLRTLPVERDRVVISFPKERKKGKVTYRLTVPGTESVTGAVTPEMTVKVKKKKKRNRR
ncbi:hypothetical protein [uncultured Nocardioides sp.]|uniref:hypothetical protein n=1 Tax=uncultured Nocardioides sp. TaxID=198441 RepID=UPI002621787F|nr:hypothetical protein [uncultured Nocardioides sp.]MCK5928198.1 hypothetical protein [Nocardioides sp.]